MATPTKPTNIPRWATGGSAQITEPSTGKKDLGWVPDEKPPAEFFNWIENLLYEWQQYFEDVLDYFTFGDDVLKPLETIGNLIVNGDLEVKGDLTYITSGEVDIGDAEIMLNANITDDSQNADGGVRVKVLDDETQANRDVASFTAPGTITMDNGSHGFVIGDYIQISGATTSENDGHYKLSNVAAAVLSVVQTYKAVDTSEAGGSAKAARNIPTRIFYDYSESKWKVQIGDSIFPIGAGGAGLEVIEHQSHLEKEGITYPISNPSFANESFTNKINLILTLAQDYASGTTMYLDHNMNLIEAMDDNTNWTSGTGTPTLADDTTNYLEGGTSVKMSQTINGIIDMYQSFSAFSLINKLLRVRVYPDTLTNGVRAFVKLESSASNDVTYYFPIAGLTGAAWNWLTVDLDATPDASTGTFNRASVTKITLGWETNSSQAVNISWDYMVDVPNWKIKLPMIIPIYDNSNQEFLKIASEDGTVDGKYVITALSNAYTILNTFAKIKTGTVGGNKGIHESGSGAHDKDQWFMIRKLLGIKDVGTTLQMSCRFWDDEFVVSDFTSTTITKLTSASDKSGYFLDTDKIILYKKQFIDTGYQGYYDANVENNFYIVTLTTNSSHGSGEITLTHGAKTIPSNTDNWYAVRLSAEMHYKIEDIASNGDLAELTPSIFNPLADEIAYSEIDGITSHWKMNETSGFEPDWKGNFNLLVTGTVLSGSGKLNLSRGPYSAANYFTLAHNPIFNQSIHLIEFWFKITKSGADQFLIIKGDATGTGTWYIYYDDTDRKIHYRVYIAGWQDLVSANIFDDGEWHYLAAYQRATSGANERQLWIDNSFEAQGTGGTITINGTGLFVGVNQSAGLPLTNGSLDDIAFWALFSYTHAEIQEIIARRWNNGIGRRYGSSAGYMIRGEASGQTGKKFVAATKLTRNDTTNQNPIIYQRDALLF